LAQFSSHWNSAATWLITSLSPGGGEKMSKHSVSAGHIAALLLLQSEGIESSGLRRHAADGGPRPTGSTARLWCARACSAATVLGESRVIIESD
jgi:hypothetical protein